MTKTSKLVVRALSVLTILLVVSSPALAIIDVCLWYSNGCFVSVFQYSWGFWDIGWGNAYQLLLSQWRGLLVGMGGMGRHLRRNFIPAFVVFQ